MRIQELTCFGAQPGQGNPAFVIEGGPAGAAARLAFARERNTTCVFLDAASEPGVARALDYYYPHTRSPLCLHATLGAARVLLAPGSVVPLTVTTAMHRQHLILSRDSDAFFVQLAAQCVPQPAALPDIGRLLGRPGLVPRSAPQVASVGSPKLLVEVPDTATLHALQPDLAAITAWGKQHGVNGLYAYCRHPDGRYEGRNFNHLDPLLEDSATGVAAGALSALLGHGITLLQGRATGRACLIHTRVTGAAILVGGAVEG